MTASVLDVVATPAALRAGASHTGLLLRLRWRMIRTIRSRIMVVLGLAVLFAAMFASSSVGFMVRRIAEQGTDSAMSQFAVNYILALERGDFGGVGALALGSAVAASLFSPFTGAANLSLAPGEDLAGLRPARLHRYFDALVTAGVSTIGFVQLLTLTAVASLLTLGGGRVGGMLFTWAVWVPLLLAAVAEGWAIEWLHRRLGAKARRSVLAGLATILGAAILLDPAHGRTLFGLGTVYSRTLRAAGEGHIGTTITAIAVLTAVSVGLVFLGASVCQAALALPAVPVAGTKDRKRLIPISRHPQIAMFQILVSIVVRTGEIRRPIGTVLLLGIPAVWITSSGGQTMSTLVIAIPLAVALAWGVNCFGIIGPGMTWLASQPHVMKRLLTLTTLIQIGATMGVALLVWGPPLVFGRADLGSVATVAAGLAASAAMTTRSAASKAVRKPLLARLGTRGDVIVPPLTAINYTLRFALWGGQVGVLVMGQGANRQVQGALVVTVLAWTTARYIQLLWQWRDRTTQARVVAAVSAA